MVAAWSTFLRATCTTYLKYQFFLPGKVLHSGSSCEWPAPEASNKHNLSILGGHLTRVDWEQSILLDSCLADTLLSQTPLSKKGARFHPSPHPPKNITNVWLKKFQLLQTFAYENNKNDLTAAFSLACLEIRSRNEEAINSTRNRIYSLKVLYLPPTLVKSSILLFICFWIDLVCVLMMTRNTCAVPGYMSV